MTGARLAILSHKCDLYHTFTVAAPAHGHKQSSREGPMAAPSATLPTGKSRVRRKRRRHCNETRDCRHPERSEAEIRGPVSFDCNDQHRPKGTEVTRTVLVLARRAIGYADVHLRPPAFGVGLRPHKAATAPEMTGSPSSRTNAARCRAQCFYNDRRCMAAMASRLSKLTSASKPRQSSIGTGTKAGKSTANRTVTAQSAVIGPVV